VAQLSVEKFSDILNGVFKDRLNVHYSESQLDKLLKEFKAFRNACMEESGNLYTPLHEQAKKERTDWNDHSWDVVPSKDYGNL
jgi:hypothetical protein